MSRRIIAPFLFVLIFLSAFALYLHTMAPTLTFGDSGELISMISTLGIPHPTGFPLYILAGRIFSFLPLSNPAFRINLMSAFFGALTPAFLFLALCAYLKNEKNAFIKYFISASAALLFIFSYTLWSQSAMSRIYTLNSSFCAAVLLLFFLSSGSRENSRYLFLWALLTGLGSGLHLTLAVFSGILWLHMALTNFSALKKHIFGILFFALLGLGVYIYLIIRSHSPAELKWSDLNTFGHFFSYISQQQYNIKKFARDPGGILAFFIYLKDVMFRELSPLAICIFIAGAFAAAFRREALAPAFLAIFVSAVLMLLFYGNYTDLKLAFRYMIPSYIIMVFFIAYFYHTVFIFTKNRWIVMFTIAVFSSMMIALCLGVNYFESNKRDNFTAYNYVSDVLKGVPEDSAGLFTTGDGNIYPLAYFRYTLREKPGLRVYDRILTVFKDSKELFEKSKSDQPADNILAALSLGRANLYSAVETGSKLFYEIPSGLLFRISQKPGPPDYSVMKTFPLKGVINGPVIFHDFE